MNTLPTVNAKRWSVLAFNLAFVLLLCAACGKDEAPDAAAAAAKSTAPAASQATGLVKKTVKLGDTADAMKWMDMASTKTPAQIAKEEKQAKEAKDAKLAAEAKEAKQIADAKAAADAKLIADANAKALAAKVAAAAKEKEAAKVVAAAPAPTPAPAVAQTPTLSVIAKEQPKYPRTAAQDGVTSGLVTAQVSIETDGRVSKVEIIKATPRKYFDKAVIAAAMQWKYAPISKPMTTTLEFNFKLDGEGS